jgi:hypothetical protein
MQLDPRYQERIAVIITVVIGILGAIMLGKMTAQGQTGLIAMIGFGAIAVASLIHFRERVWVIIPVLWPFYGSIPVLPIPFALKDIGIMVAFLATIVCIALKIIRFRPRFTYLDALLYLNGVWLFIAFIRNPVGFLVSDSERVGGRPYVSALFGVLAYWVLSRISSSPERLRRVPMYVIGALFVFFLVNALMVVSPVFGGFAAQFYSGFDFYFVDGAAELAAGYGAGQRAVDDGTVRIEMFRDIGKYTCVFLSAYFYPPSLLNPMNWKRFAGFISTMLGLLLSGFRSFLFYAGAIFLIGSYFQKGWTSVLRSGVAALLAIFILMLGHGTLYELPFAAQRALAIVPSILRPVQLDERAILSGESSTDWRVEMWIQALTTNRYISDKMLGDGFGMTRAQIAVFQRAVSMGPISNQESQEQMAIAGDFHSGPISTIRVVGVVGLAFFYVLLIVMALHAARLIVRSKGTPFFAPTMFFCLPIVFEPFWFTFVFGGFNMAIPFAGISVGMIKCLENSLKQWQNTQLVVKLGTVPQDRPSLAPA